MNLLKASIIFTARKMDKPGDVFFFYIAVLYSELKPIKDKQRDRLHFVFKSDLLSYNDE